MAAEKLERRNDFEGHTLGCQTGAASWAAQPTFRSNKAWKDDLERLLEAQTGMLELWWILVGRDAWGL